MTSPQLSPIPDRLERDCTSAPLLRDERACLRMAVRILEERARSQDPVRLSPEFAKLCARYLRRLLAD